MSGREAVDVLVAGGGVAGLAATAAFAAAGFRTVCVDPAPPVTEAGAEGADLRTTAFLAPSVALLERAGLWARLAPHAAMLRVMRIADAGGAEPGIRASAEFRAEEIGAEAFGYNLPNWLLRREMVAHLAGMGGAELRAGTAATGFTPRLREALVRLSDGSRIAARLVVAADGRDSFLREAAGIGVARWSYGQKAVVFSVTHPLPHDDVSTEIHRSGGPFTLAPLPDAEGLHRSAVVWMEAGPRAAELAALPVPEFEMELGARACGVLGELRLVGRRLVWPIIAQAAERLDGPRLALAAEAAHVAPPIGAQGLNMSLADIGALVELAAAARAAGEDWGGAGMLARYDRTRRPEMLARIAGVDLLNRASIAGSPALRDARLAGLRALHGVPPLRRTAMRLGMGARRHG